MKRLTAILTAALMIAAAVPAMADENESKDAALSLAYQYGLGYAPATIAQQEGLIEKAYKDATGGDLTITWNQMSSGADINTGIASGDIDAGFMGVGPALTGVTRNLGYKIFTNLTGQEHGIMVNDENIKSFDDLIGSDYQMALVNIGSIQHILLAKTLAAKGYDPHALDANLVAMKHPDGMAALMSGAVAAHLTSNPYLFKEREDSTLHEIEALSESCSKEDSFLVGIASEKLHDEQPELYNALVKGIADGMDMINNDIENAAKITAEFDGNDIETEIAFLKEGSYEPETKGVKALADFMYENQFLENEPGEYADLVFENVKGD